MKYGGVGRIEYENKDTTPINEQKERFLYFHKFFIEKGKNIAVTLATLDYLTTHEEDSDNITTVSPAFMHTVSNNFWAQAIIELDAFYYEKNDLSFNAFFNYVKANWNLIFTGDFYEHIYHVTEKRTRQVKFTRTQIFNTITECENIILENKEKLSTLRNFRDKVFAHYGDLSKEKKEYTISIDELQSILNITQQILNKIEVFYDRTNTVLTPINATDIYQTCYVIKKFKEYRNEIRELDLKKMNSETGGNK